MAHVSSELINKANDLIAGGFLFCTYHSPTASSWIAYSSASDLTIPLPLQRSYDIELKYQATAAGVVAAATCSCPGFRDRRLCSHLLAIKTTSDHDHADFPADWVRFRYPGDAAEAAALDGPFALAFRC
jgi:hypothetical protein